MLTSPIPAKTAGFTLVELMIAIAIGGILFTLGLASVRDMMANARTKGTAESILNGLRKTKSEAIKRNVPMRFQLVSSLADGCAYSTSSPLWIATETDQAVTGDPVPSCGSASIVFKSPSEVPPDVLVDSHGASVVTFSPIGLVLDNMGGTARLSQIDVTSTHPDATPWRILITSGGGFRMCNAGAGIKAGDPLKCP